MNFIISENFLESIGFDESTISFFKSVDFMVNKKASDFLSEYELKQVDIKDSNSIHYLLQKTILICKQVQELLKTKCPPFTINVEFNTSKIAITKKITFNKNLDIEFIHDCFNYPTGTEEFLHTFNTFDDEGRLSSTKINSMYMVDKISGLSKFPIDKIAKYEYDDNGVLYKKIAYECVQFRMLSVKVIFYDLNSEIRKCTSIEFSYDSISTPTITSFNRLNVEHTYDVNHKKYFSLVTSNNITSPFPLVFGLCGDSSLHTCNSCYFYDEDENIVERYMLNLYGKTHNINVYMMEQPSDNRSYLISSDFTDTKNIHHKKDIDPLNVSPIVFIYNETEDSKFVRYKSLFFEFHGDTLTSVKCRNSSASLLYEEEKLMPSIIIKRIE